MSSALPLVEVAGTGSQPGLSHSVGPSVWVAICSWKLEGKGHRDREV